MRLTRLFPQLSGLHIDRLEATATQLTIAAHTVRRTASCPLCQRRSRRVHSRYQRRVGDLPCSGRTVVLLIGAPLCLHEPVVSAADLCGAPAAPG